MLMAINPIVKANRKIVKVYRIIWNILQKKNIE